MPYLNEEGVMLMTAEEENWFAARQPKPVIDVERYEKLEESFRIDFIMDIQESLSVEGRKELHHRIAGELGLIEPSIDDLKNWPLD